MNDSPLMIRSWPQAIVHIDGDAFFASCEQAIHPELRGRPVVTGKERGIVAAASYEAKAKGVKRGVALRDVPKMCPDAVILPSDYETYSLFSKRMFAVMRRFTGVVEEYSIDEAFADITGLRRPLRAKYPEIARQMKVAIEQDLGLTVSVGLSLSKTLAKVGSKWQKPAGLTAIPGRKIHEFLRELDVEKIWGIGPATAAYCRQLNIRTAWDFAQKDEAFIRDKFTKPHYETWQELNGQPVYQVTTQEKTSYASISKTKTFTPPSVNREYVWSQLLKNLENACIKARRHELVARKMMVYLVTQQYQYAGLEAKLTRPTAFPIEMACLARQMFDQLFRSGQQYRATGIVLADLRSGGALQLDLFHSPAKIDKLTRLYEAVDQVAAKFGKHGLHSAAAHTANETPQHILDRGDVPLRKLTRLPGESRRKHLGLPLLSPKGAK
jgi:nucleotidyltransferase/DNA polymerase involved in DNA repair